MNRTAASSMTAVPQATAEAPPAPIAAEGLPPVVSSQAVLQGRSSVAIEHNGAVYRLQTTRQGKLILTK
jgi:hemin uptake protein HemP